MEMIIALIAGKQASLPCRFGWLGFMITIKSFVPGACSLKTRTPLEPSAARQQGQSGMPHHLCAALCHQHLTTQGIQETTSLLKKLVAKENLQLT
jgi:hypothetical protein